MRALVGDIATSRSQISCIRLLPWQSVTENYAVALGVPEVLIPVEKMSSTCDLPSDDDPGLSIRANQLV